MEPNMVERPQDDEVVINLGDLWQALKRKKKFIAACVGGCLALGLALTLGLHPGYEATTSLRLQRADQTYIDTLTSRSVVLEAALATQNPENAGKERSTIYEAYKKRIKVNSSNKNKALVSFTVKGKEAEETEKFAKLLLQNYSEKIIAMECKAKLLGIKLKLEGAEQDLTDFKIKYKIYDSKDLIKVTSKGSSFGRDIRNAELEGKLAELENNVKMLRQTERMLAESAKYTSNIVDIVDPVEVDRARRKGALKMALALLLGLIASCGYVVAKEITHPTLKRPEELAEQLGLATLGDVPLEEEKRLDAYRSLRTNLLNAEGAKTILFTTMGEDNNATDVCGEVAHLLSSSDYKVALANPAGLAVIAQGAALGVDKQTGVSKAVLDRMPVNGSESLASKKVDEALAKLSAEYDYILVDATQGKGEALTLCGKFAGVVPILTAEQVSPDEARGYVKTMQQAGAKFLGAVLKRA